MSRLSFLLIAVSVFFYGCIPIATNVVPEKTQLEIREFQTRSYETTDTKMVLKAVLNVLQDDGFIVKNADAELGLLNASKEIDVEDSSQAFVAMMLAGSNAKWQKNSVIEASANVSEFGKETRVRVNFQAKTFDNKGGVVKVEPIADAKFYQEFFSKVDKGIFIQKEKI